MDTEIPQTAIDYIHSLGRFSGKPGLHRIRALCAALSDPQDGCNLSILRARTARARLRA